MSVHTSLDTLIERVLAEDARKHDFLADTRRMSVEFAEDEKGDDVTRSTTVLLNVDGANGVGQFIVTEHAVGQMATDLGVPKRYFDRMREEAPDLFRTNVHHWMYAEPSRRLVRARTIDPFVSGEAYTGEYAARAWLSDRYRRLDNVEIAKRLLPEFDNLGTEVVFHNASVTDEKFHLRAVFPKMEADVKVGDAVQWGVQIRNSEVGAGAFSIDSFVLRLVCINGMVVAKVMNARHIGKRLGENLSDEAIQADDKAFWLAARDELRASVSEAAFQTVVSSLRETTDGEKITAPIAATERLAKSLSLSDEERDAVLVQLASGGDMTRWGALNAVTAAAKEVENFDRRVEMEEMGWSLATITEREWSRIAVAS